MKSFLRHILPLAVARAFGSFAICTQITDRNTSETSFACSVGWFSGALWKFVMWKQSLYSNRHAARPGTSGCRFFWKVTIRASYHWKCTTSRPHCSLRMHIELHLLQSPMISSKAHKLFQGLAFQFHHTVFDFPVLQFNTVGLRMRCMPRVIDKQSVVELGLM